MNKWFGTALVALTISSASFADTSVKSTTPAQTPAIVVSVSGHASSHVTKFSAVIGKSSYWQSEAATKGYDVAFTEWMQQDHPREFANDCVKMAPQVIPNTDRASQLSEFNSVQGKNAGLRSSVQAVGSDAAFLIWQRVHYPASYAAYCAKSAPAVSAPMAQ
jgi:hypothetical protein